MGGTKNKECSGCGYGWSKESECTYYRGERERERADKLKVGKCVGGSLVEYFGIQLCRVSIKINVSR